MVTIYPKRVEHTTYDKVLNETCCNGRGYGTQKLYSAENILKASSYASWGEESTNASGPSGNSPKAIATPSGTRRQPEEIIVTQWDTSSLPSDAIITAIQAEVKYFTEGYKNYSYVPGFFPDATSITLANSKGATISSKKIPGPTKTEKEHVASFSSLKLSPSDLKKAQVRIQVGENKQNGVVCRVKIKYIRIKIVKYEVPTPKYKLSADVSPNPARTNSDFKYECTINSQNGYSKKTTFYVQIPNEVNITSKIASLKLHKTQSTYREYKCDISQATNKIWFTGQSSADGTKHFKTYLSNYGINTINPSVVIKKPEIKFNLSCKVSDADTNGNNLENLYTPQEYSFMAKEKYVKFYITLDRSLSKLPGKAETAKVTTSNFTPVWTKTDDFNINGDIITFNKNKVTIESEYIYLNKPQVYGISVKYNDAETGKTQTDTYRFNITSEPLKKEYFKLRLEDGSDVQYNSLRFARGDDLKIPLTYTSSNITDIAPEDFIIKGENKKIAIGEAEYITFNVSLNKDKEQEYAVENVLASIEAFNKDGEDCTDIIIGVDSNGELLDSKDGKYCAIKRLNNQSPTQLRIALLSNVEQVSTIKIKPYNYDLYGKEWTPCQATFSEIPNIKLYIDSDKNDIHSNDEIQVYYYIENKSDVHATNLKFQLIEPPSFEIVEDIDKDNMYQGVSFNPVNRMITFSEMEARSARYIFMVKYKATRKGIYDFIINTVDNKHSVLDDQNPNTYKYKVLVDIVSNIHISTIVDKHRPSVGDIIDFTIKVENRLKAQEKFTFNITDIGDYEPMHNTGNNFDGKDYTIAYVDCDVGEFTPNEEENGVIGEWTISKIPINAKYRMTLSLKPTKQGLHTIHTDFTNQTNNNDNDIQSFNNRITVLEAKKQLSFEVHQAVIDDDVECPDIDDLIIICDDDYINLTDDIYYIIEVKNNDSVELVQDINVYARLDKSFLENDIKCYTPDYKPIKDSKTSLLNIPIHRIEGCKTCRFFFKITPSQEGRFTSNFMLATKTADVYQKQLHLTVDSEFNQRELEHEINIYNFEKTNRNYRYEIDNNGEIFKFFNKGDRTVRPIETEKYNVNLIETYKGTNLKNIVKNIKENSKYVDPVFLRTGNNKLADRGYELYPDGFIRRFGLLKSEVFHHTHQLPVITDLGEKAFKWNIDEWDLKVWAGDPYDNGIFDLTIDYSKIPSNFNILEIDNPINKLQNIVDKTKPYGTKGICYYSAQSQLDFKINIDDISLSIGSSIDLLLKFADIFLVTTLNRHDASLAVINDVIKLNTNIDYEIAYDFAFNYRPIGSKKPYPDKETLKPNFKVGVDSICIYDDNTEKKYIEDCMDILRNLYDTNNNTKNIDITFPYQKFDDSSEPTFLHDYQFMHCINNCVDNQFIGRTIKYYGNIINFGYKREDINNFEGFVLEVNGEEFNRRKNTETVSSFSIGTYEYYENDIMTIHFWGSVNGKEYYHIGFIEFTNSKVSDNDLLMNVESNFFIPYNNTYNTHEDNDCQPSYTEYKSYNNAIDIKRKIPITFKIADQIKEKKHKHTHVREVGSKKWHALQNINYNNEYALFSYNSKVDKECSNESVKVPRLAFKYDTNIGTYKEVTDIDFTIKAQSNKPSFMDDLSISLFKDGNYIYPTNVSSKFYYPQSITNPTKDLLTNYVIKQPNITICTECLKTALGYYDKCPYCQSQEVSHSHKTEAVTICKTCQWVEKGTNDICTHCLSLDVENVDVDYNKTYCNKCKKIVGDEYYHRCPQCFSPDVVYLDNKQQMYQLLSNAQNIEPIVIQTQETEVNIFNISIPFDSSYSILNQLESLTFNIHYTNRNQGRYHYCIDCGRGGLGFVDTCPHCNNKRMINKTIEANNFNAYIRNDQGLSKIDFIQDDVVDNTIHTGQSVKRIDLLELAKKNNNLFDLEFYIDNSYVDVNIKNIMDYDMADEDLQSILDVVNNFDITIDNITVDCVFKDDNEWVDLKKLNGNNHTGLKYNLLPDEKMTEPIEIYNFNIPNGQYDNAFLYLTGLCKTSSQYDLIVYVTRGNDTFTKTIQNIHSIPFDYKISLNELRGDLSDIKVEVFFNNVEDANEIIITNCSILIEKESAQIRDKQEIDNSSEIEYVEKNHTYLIKNDNMWGLNDSEPYYLSDKQLESNLLCYIDFGKIQSSEYIRLYNIYMTIYYKTKTGKITTDTINVINNNNIEQYINGQITKNNGEIWGSIKESQKALNNLESEDLNIDEYSNIINAIPLYNKIAQSFQYPTDNINQIELKYFGKKGYPSDIINIYLYDDFNNRPNDLIAQKRVIMPLSKGHINVDFNVDNIKPNSTYWIVLEDSNADNNNYHRFNYNTYQDIGTLIYNTTVSDKDSICFCIYSANDKQSYYNFPTEWTVIPVSDIMDSEGVIENYVNEELTEQPTGKYDIVQRVTDNDNDIPIEYKMTNTFYRYNIQDNSNITLSNIVIKNGHYLE